VLPPSDPHMPAFDDERAENAALLALGEPVEAWFEEHQRSCDRCQDELDQLHATIDLAREGSGQRWVVDGPSPAVWNAIAAQIGIVEPAPARIVSDRRLHSTSVRWRFPLAVAAAAVVAVLAGAIGVGIGRGSGRSTAAGTVVSHAVLVQQSGPSSAKGTAAVRQADGHIVVTVQATGLPLRQGYYQAWLYDPRTAGMFPLGALDADGDGTFTVDASIDLRSFDVIDVSAQDFGSYIHPKQSVLQGPLTQ
jgi:anti-sigma-K factor RskA